MASEIELKLAVSPQHVARLARLPLLKSASRGRAKTTHVYSVYYDTPEFSLRDHGAALRLRRLGSHWVQTLKTAGRVEAGLHQREETETPVAAQILNYQALQQACALDLFADPELPRKLAPVFVTDFKRTTRQLELAPGNNIEFCLDRGSISTGNAQTPISEVELELKAGLPAHIIDFALQLVRQVPLRLAPMSKAQRGYALAIDGAETPVKASTPALAPEMTVTEAFRTVVFNCVSHLQANERGLLETDDHEYLHQARVALRRLRSAFSIFKQAFPRSFFEQHIAELRWLGSHLSSARDWDVFLSETLPPVCGAFPQNTGLSTLSKRATRLQTSANTKAREAIASSRYTVLLLELAGTLLRAPWSASDEAAQEREQSLVSFASRVLEHRHRSALKHGRQLRQLDAAGLHQLRIRIKKLRYAAEFFSQLYGKKALRDYVRALAKLQEFLGKINDAATAARLIEALEPTRAEAPREALDLLRGWCAAYSRAPLDRLPSAWNRFKSCEVFW